MSKTAKNVYKEKLNWDIWATKVESVISNILEEKRNMDKCLSTHR